ncbi:hypothetical protein P8C59_007351 [Phyllachora maydis]|uniref:Uncharacterized protein n=1 Tax=Phyllachora maydis TaxID=1825666 RepID=A0AAD9IA12_9PEZI|nr:hypothetical protein P8C59_007351 [Phyllachora maydis]
MPIPNALDDDEFPIRTPATAMATTTITTTDDDEFPMRQPGAGYASPVPLDGPETADEVHVDADRDLDLDAPASA